MRRYLWLFVAALTAVGVTVGVAWSAPGPDGSGSTSTEHRFTHMYTVGPSASCDGDSCGIGTVPSIPVRLPAASHSYSGTITVSLGYTTHGDGEFRVQARLRTLTAPYRMIGVTLPRYGRTLGPAARRTSTALVFEVTGIPGDRRMNLDVGLSIGERNNPRTDISTANMLVQARFAVGG